MAVMVCSAFAVLATAVDVPGAIASGAVSVSATGTTPAAPTAAQLAAESAETAAIAANTAKYDAIASSLEAAGAKPNLIHLPSALPSPVENGAVVPGPLYAEEIDAVKQGYTTSPAPAGIAYYGEGGADSGSSETEAVLDTSSLAGTLNVTNLSTLYLDTDNPDQWGAQLNAVATNVTLENTRGTATEGFAYWTQNVIGYEQHNDSLQFDENTWNFTSTAESFPTDAAGTIVANDTNDTLYDDEVFLGESQWFYAPTPFNLTLYTNLSLYNNLICSQWSSLASTSTCNNPAAAEAGYAGDQTLFYNFSLTFPASNHKVAPGTHYSGNFDWLTFHTAATGSAEDNGANTRSAGLEASGYADEVIGLTDDYELDFGIGAYDGANQDDFNGSGTASLAYVADCSKPSGTEATCTIPASPTYKSVPSALNFGSQTGEDAVGINVDFSGQTAVFSAGPLNLHPLWGYTAQSGVNSGATAVTNDVTVSGSPLAPLPAQPYIFVFLEDTSVTAPADNYAWAPDTSTWYLMPGTYNYEAMLADYTEQTGSITVGSTPTTLTATLPYSTTNGVYTPLWALSNGQLAGISTSGTGTVGNQYVLFNNNDTASSQALTSNFNTKDDYDFPSFQGLLLWGTTAYTELHNSVYFYTGSTGLYLQQELYQTQHVTIANAGSINGWEDMETLDGTPAAQNPIPVANLMIWDSSNDLVYHDAFLAVKASTSLSGAVSPALLLLFGGTNNVVWGNTFKDPSGTTVSTPGTYAGLAEAENGDLIYNNYFDVDNPVLFMPWDIYTEEGPIAPASDTWNITEQAATNVAYTVNGFALSGNIIGSSQPFQGGNEWWNYANSLNPATTTPYTNIVDYSDIASYYPPGYAADEPGIGVGGDHVPLAGFTLTFTESGLPASTTWHTTVLGVTETSTSTTNAYTETPNGVYAYSIPSVPGYYASPSSGSVTVDGAAKGVTITFTKTLVATLSPSSATTQVGGPVTLTIATTGGASPVHWTLTVNGSSTNLSGAGSGRYTFDPAYAGVYTFYLNATDAVGQTSDVLSTVTVQPALVATLSPPSATTQVGGSVTFSVGFAGGVAPITYTLQANGPGLSGDVFSPTAAGTYTIYLNATDAVGSVSDVTSTVTVEPALVASLSASPATTQVGGTSTISLGFSGGVAPVAWTLELSGSSANLSGVSGDTYDFAPAAPGTYTFYLNATDAVGSVSDVTTTVTVDPALVATLSPPTATTAVGDSVTFSVGLSGGVAPVTYTLQASGPGLSGDVFTPTGAGIFTVYLNATDAVGSVSDVTATVTVEAGFTATLSATPTTTQVGGTSTLALAFLGGVAPVTWTLEVNGSSANLSGVSADSYAFDPAASGTYTFYLNASDAIGDTSSATASVTVEPALVATLSPPTSTTQVGGSVTFSVGLSGGVAPVTYTLQASGPGLSGDVFSPTAAGTYTIYLNATDAVGSVSDVTAIVTVEPALVASLSPPASTTQVGGAVVLTVGLAGGVAPVTYTLQASGPGLAGDVFTPTAPGVYTIYLNASDAVGSVSDVTAIVTVEPALVATLSPPTSTTQVGGSVTFSVGLSGGVAPATYTLQASGPGLTGDVFTPTAPGVYTIYLNATDAVGSVSDVTATVTVEPALVATLSPPASTTQVGGAVVLTVGLAGGVAPVTYTLAASGPGLSGDVFTPTAPGVYTIYLNATDAVGSVSDVTATVTVDAALVAGLSPPTSTTQVGGSVTFSVGLSGGVAPVTYTLQASGPGLSGDLFTPTAVGTYTIYLNATDAVGSVSDVTATVTVEPALVASLSPPTSTIHLGGSVTFTVGHTGGVAPVTYTLQASGPGLAGDVFTPTAPGTYTIYLNATDAVGSVSDVTATVTVESSLLTKYSVTFTESGLPVKGKTWQVSFDGTTVKTAATSKSATVTSIEFNVTNGTYPYIVTGPSGYAVAAFPDGSVVVTGSFAVVDVNFVKGPTPTITFHEVGLGGGSKWSVTLGGTLTVTSTKATVVFKNLTPAAYAYSIGTVGSATSLVKVGTTWTVASTGTVSNSKGVTVQVRFGYLVTFTETGLASGTSWTVTSEGESGTSTGTTIGLYLTNGTDGFSVHKVTGYTETSAPSGHVLVSGGPAGVSVKFTAKPGGEPAAGVPATKSVLQDVVRAVEAVFHL